MRKKLTMNEICRLMIKDCDLDSLYKYNSRGERNPRYAYSVYENHLESCQDPEGQTKHGHDEDFWEDQEKEREERALEDEFADRLSDIQARYPFSDVTGNYGDDLERIESEALIDDMLNFW